MIVSFRSRALRRYWERSEVRRLPPEFVARIGMVLDRLDLATEPRQMNAPGLRFHALTGNMKGRFAVNISANWRVTFGWSGEDAIEVDLEDYH
jgi:proteic killer suppression protein